LYSSPGIAPATITNLRLVGLAHMRKACDRKTLAGEQILISIFGAGSFSTVQRRSKLAKYSTIRKQTTYYQDSVTLLRHKFSCCIPKFFSCNRIWNLSLFHAIARDWETFQTALVQQLWLRFKYSPENIFFMSYRKRPHILCSDW